MEGGWRAAEREGRTNMTLRRGLKGGEVRGCKRERRNAHSRRET